MSRPAPLPHLVDVETIAEHLGVEVRHIRRLVHEKRIPFIKVGPPRPLRPHRGRRMA